MYYIDEPKNERIEQNFNFNNQRNRAISSLFQFDSTESTEYLNFTEKRKKQIRFKEIFQSLIGYESDQKAHELLINF